MIDVSVKFALVAGGVWLLTRHASPSRAAAAHRVWLLVLAVPLLWFGAAALIEPAVIVRPRASVWPESSVAPSSAATSVAVAVYVVVAGLLMARVATGALTVQRLLRHASRLPESELSALRMVAADASLDIREADVPLPVTAGFVSPAVILPAGWRDMRASALAAIVRHEAAHVRRMDCSVALGCALIEAVCWFHPAVWLATSRIRWFAEMACDAAAVRAMDAGQYAAELLALAGDRGPRSTPFAITAGAHTAIARRIGLLLDEIEGRRRRNLVPWAAAAVLIAAPCLMTVSIGATARPEIDAPEHAIVHQQRHQREHAGRH